MLSLKQLRLLVRNLNEENLEYFKKMLLQGEITKLALGGLRIDGHRAGLVTKALAGTNVAILDLRWNEIDPQGVAFLAKGLRGTNITTLNLECNHIGPQGAATLGKNLRGSNVTVLNLGINVIGSQGAAALAENLRGTNVTTLNLKFNHIDSKGAAAVIKNLFGTNVTNLDFEGNEINPREIAAIIENLYGTNITSLNLAWNHNFAGENIEAQYIATAANRLQNTQLLSLIGIKSLELSNALKRQQAALITPYLLLQLGNLPAAYRKTYLKEITLSQTSDPSKSLRYAAGIFMNLPSRLRCKVASYLPFMQHFKQCSPIEQSLKYLALAHKWHPSGLRIAKTMDPFFKDPSP